MEIILLMRVNRIPYSAQEIILFVRPRRGYSRRYRVKNAIALDHVSMPQILVCLCGIHEL